jgi:hypothetical protein
MTVTALARKPVIRNVEGSDILSELQASERQDETRLISVYIPDAGAHIMYESVNNKMRWQGAWAPISRQDAIECAREHAYNNGVAAQDNLLYIPQGFNRGASGYVWGDVDAGSDCLSIEALARYQDNGNDCLVVLYSPVAQEVQQYRLCNGLCEWWHKASPYTLEAAKHMANREREERGLTFEQLHFVNVATAMRDGGGGHGVNA